MASESETTERIAWWNGFGQGLGWGALLVLLAAIAGRLWS